MIEVLISGDLVLPEETRITCFSEADAGIAQDIVNQLEPRWDVALGEPPGPYGRRHNYADAVREFIDRALADPNWRGNGLEFDRV